MAKNDQKKNSKQNSILDESSDSPKDEWEIVGWMNNTKGKVLSVQDADENLIGFINKKQMDRFLSGEITGVPIKKPSDA